MTLIFDIETKALDDKPDPLKDEFRFLGAQNVETGEYYFLENHNEVKELIRKHKVIIGFNSKYYDEPILKRYGLIPYRHIHIDLLDILKKRETVLNIKNTSKSLTNIAKTFGLSEDKDNLDYSLLHKEVLLEHEYELIKRYTLQDIKVTRELFDYLCDFFKDFKLFMNSYDVQTYKWLTSSISVYSYKVICKAAGLKEKYAENVEHLSFPGGYVAEPSKKEEHEDVYCLDFNSLYPHNMIQANLFSYNCKCCKKEEKWKGNELFPIKGSYCSKSMGKIEQEIHKIYLQRKKLKREGNPAEYALKIVINTLYGLTGNPVFQALYNYNAAYDCTLIGRESIKLSRRMFDKAGYEILYTDTDSVFLKDPFKNKERLLKTKTEIVNTIKKNLPLEVDTFDMGIDAEIKHIWFFEKNKSFLKKHYIYVENNGKLTIKGLPMKKNDSSKIGYQLFNKYMKQEVINGNINFSYQNIKKWLHDILKQDISFATRIFKVRNFDSYKNENQLQAQISKKYGKGIHKLLANKYIGVGKSIKYCTVEDFKKKGLTLNSLVLNKFWAEMEYFSNYTPGKFKMGKDNSQIHLSAWVKL